MNTYKTTALLAIVLAGLGMYLYTIELPSIEQTEQQYIEEQRLLPFDYRDVIELTMATGSETVHMERDNRGRWMITAPIVTKGDSREIGGLLRAMELGRVTRVIQPDSQEAIRYGLAQPHATITIKTPDLEERLDLGDVEPLSSALYAKRGSDQQILLTTLSVQDFRRKSLLSLRHKDVLFFDRLQAVGLTISSPGREPITLHRTPSVHGLTGNWQFTTPLEGPADKTTVGLLLMTLEDLQAKQFIDSPIEKTRLAKTLGVPDREIHIQTDHGRLQVSFFRSGSDSGTGYAITSPTDPIFAIDPSLIQRLPRDIFDLQDRRLFGLTTEEIALLRVTTPTISYTLAQQHGKWYLDDQPEEELSQQRVSLFISRIVDLPAEIPIDRNQSSLEKYGLVRPAIEVVAIDTKGRRRGYLALGKQESGLIYAIGGGLPGIYQARDLILSQIPDLATLKASGQPF